jgi:hypothetical protein
MTESPARGTLAFCQVCAEDHRPLPALRTTSARAATPMSSDRRRKEKRSGLSMREMNDTIARWVGTF